MMYFDGVNSVYLNPAAMSMYAHVDVAMDGGFHSAIIRVFAPQWFMSSTTNKSIGPTSSQLRHVEKFSFSCLFYCMQTLPPNRTLNTQQKPYFRKGFTHL
jgi:hypothetical protein